MPPTVLSPNGRHRLAEQAARDIGPWPLAVVDHHRMPSVSLAADLFKEGDMDRHWHIAGVAMALLLIPYALAAAEPRWRQGQPIPQGANEVIGARVGDAQLVYGGQSQSGEPMGIFWMYEPSGDRWTQLPSNPVPVHHATAVGIDNKLYLFGGFVLVKEQ